MVMLFRCSQAVMFLAHGRARTTHHLHYLLSARARNLTVPPHGHALSADKTVLYSSQQDSTGTATSNYLTGRQSASPVAASTLKDKVNLLRNSTANSSLNQIQNAEKSLSTLGVGECTKTTTSTSSNSLIGSDYSVLHHRSLSKLIDINSLPLNSELTLFFSATKDVIDIYPRRSPSDAVLQNTDIPVEGRNGVHEQNEWGALREKDIAKVDILHNMIWRPCNITWNRLGKNYLSLAKARLTGLVVVTSAAGYFLAPGVLHIDALLLCMLGTALTSAAANALNQFLEVPYDAQMRRTQNRALVCGQISPLHAVCFAVVTASAGLATLALGVNFLTAGLGAFNLALYAFIYTPLKRLSIVNTWVGSVVGSIPPMMGWAASTGTLGAGAWLLAALMYSWQFPHFNALSWNLRPEYSRAGYRMMSVLRPDLCRRVALRHSMALALVCTAAPLVGLTTWTFGVDSIPLNLALLALTLKFYRQADSASSRRLFRFSLLYLPAVLLLMLISKKSEETASTGHSHELNLLAKENCDHKIVTSHSPGVIFESTTNKL